MPVLEILLIAVALSMDAFAVALASGACMRTPDLKKALKMGLFFGGFQTLMPVLGWLAGVGMKNFIAGVDHWIAFGLLALVGGKMIYEAVKPGAGEECPCGDRSFETRALFILAVATSIDALAVGITFSLLSVSLLLPVAVIGLVTFSLTVAGVSIGIKGGRFLGNKAEILGGLVLLGIGVKILFEHLAG